MIGRIQLEHLSWDSNFFGFPVGRIILPSADVEPEMLKATIRKSDETLTYVFLPTEGENDCRIELPRSAMVDLDGIRVDHKITYRKAINTVPVDGPNVMTANQVTPTLESLAYASGWRSRFVRDERLARFYKSMYLIWLKRDLDRGKVFVWPSSDSPEGMATVSVDANGLGKVGLVAVDAKSCGKGIGTILLMMLDSYLSRRGVAQCEVVTQGANLSARHLYEKVGFKLFSQYEVWHVWKGKEQ